MQNFSLFTFLHQQRFRLVLAAALLLAAVIFQRGGLTFIDQGLIDQFIIFFLSLVIEATPFIFLGICVSVLVALYFKEEWVITKLPKNHFISHFLLSLTGVFMPVCECGNVPVVRRLLLKGFKLSHGITFLLAAPIVNPITIWSTYVAFGGNWNIVLIRIVSALIIANFIGWVLSKNKKDEDLLTTEFYGEVCGHDHHHKKTKVKQGLEIFEQEFTGIMKMMVLGAFFAATIQTFVPREAILSLSQNLLMSILAMILFSFVISICASFDALFISGFQASFSLGPIMSFLVFGPMIDIKMLTMLKTTFSVKLLTIITILVTLLSILVGLVVNYLV